MAYKKGIENTENSRKECETMLNFLEEKGETNLYEKIRDAVRIQTMSIKILKMVSIGNSDIYDELLNFNSEIVLNDYVVDYKVKRRLEGFLKSWDLAH